MHVNNVGKRLLNKNLATATLPLWDLVGGGRCRAGRKWETSQVTASKRFRCYHMVLDKVLNCSVSQIPHLYPENDNSTPFIEMFC